MIALGLAGAARATEHAAPAPASEPRAAASAPAPASAPEMRDPLDVVRDRLAAKLSTLRGPDGSGSPSVLRVVSKAQPAGADAAASAPPIIPGPVAPSRKKHALAASPAEIPHPASPHWDYAGSGGPQSWGQLKPEFATCANGSRQSPIDISGGIKVNLDPVQFDYKPSAFRVIDNGHTVQVNVGPGSSIEVMGRRYELLQFHFHRPSEERIDGKQFDMVAHLVHKDSDGRLAVVAVLLDRGSAHALVQSVWNNLPLEKGDEVAAKGTLDPAALSAAIHCAASTRECVHELSDHRPGAVSGHSFGLDRRTGLA